MCGYQGLHVSEHLRHERKRARTKQKKTDSQAGRQTGKQADTHTEHVCMEKRIVDDIVFKDHPEATNITGQYNRSLRSTGTPHCLLKWLSVWSRWTPN